MRQLVLSSRSEFRRKPVVTSSSVQTAGRLRHIAWNSRANLTAQRLARGPRLAGVVTRFRNIRPEADPDIGAITAHEYNDVPPELVAECQLRKWLGMSGARKLNAKKITTGVQGTNASMAVCGTIIEANGTQHALLAVVVKENENALKLHNLVLHWAAARRQGDQWLPPPPGYAQYPQKLFTEVAAGGMMRTPSAVHASADGKPLHVAMIQVPVEGPLSSGGVAFVLNCGLQWMHNPHGGNWFIQLSGSLPLTTDTQDLPDPDIYPATLAPAADPREASDRQLLRGKAARLSELQSQQKAAALLEAAANQHLADASAQVLKAQERLAQVAAKLSAAEASLEAASAAVLAAEAGLNQAVVAADGEQPRQWIATQADCAASRAMLWARHMELVTARAAVFAASSVHSRASAAVAQLEKVQKDACEAAKHTAASAAAVGESVSAEIAALEKLCSEASDRIWAHVQQRQLLDLRRFIVETGPSEPLELRWLLPSSMTGRSLPLVPSPFTGRLNIQSSPEGEADAQLEPCSEEDLKLIARSKLRKWLSLSPSQELHVVQYRFFTRLPGGQELPVLVWLTASRDMDEWGRAKALLVVAVDQSAAGKWRGSLQLHWGAAMREGQPPSQLAAPGWITSSEANWEANSHTLATPFSLEKFQKLDIGGRSGQTSAGSVVRNSHENGGVGADAQACAAGPRSDLSMSDRQAHVALLHLPLDDMLRNGGLAFTLKDAHGRELNNLSNGRPFFLELGVGLQYVLAHQKAADMPSAALEEKAERPMVPAHPGNDELLA